MTPGVSFGEEEIVPRSNVAFCYDGDLTIDGNSSLVTAKSGFITMEDATQVLKYRMEPMTLVAAKGTHDDPMEALSVMEKVDRARGIVMTRTGLSLGDVSVYYEKMEPHPEGGYILGNTIILLSPKKKFSVKANIVSSKQGQAPTRVTPPPSNPSR